MARTITKKELQVPSGVMFSVAAILSANEIINTIIGVDEDEDTIAIELQYEKRERDFIREIENEIADYEDDEEESDDDQEEEE